MTHRDPKARAIDLNTATEEELASVPGLGPDRLRRLLAARPFDRWEEVRDLEGFGAEAVSALQGDGASLGDKT